MFEVDPRPAALPQCPQTKCDICLVMAAYFLYFVIFQIAYKIAREQFSGRLRETFLVLSDEEPKLIQQPEASQLTLQDPRRNARKHPRDSDSMSVDSHAKKADKTRSAEKHKKQVLIAAYLFSNFCQAICSGSNNNNDVSKTMSKFDLTLYFGV